VPQPGSGGTPGSVERVELVGVLLSPGRIDVRQLGEAEADDRQGLIVWIALYDVAAGASVFQLEQSSLVTLGGEDGVRGAPSDG